MYLPKKLSSIEDTRLIGYWHEDKVPVYEVTTVHGLNQIVGYVKHTNANHGTVLYRGQARLHEKLIPSILHGNPTKAELHTRNRELSKYVKCIAGDKRMQNLLHFDKETNKRYFYKQYITESMLQHYGLRTHFQDFVDNHWTAFWFGLYELQKERIPGCPDGCDYFQYYYSRRKSILDNKEKAPACLSLEVPELMSLPSAPKLYPILSESEYTEDLLLDKKNAKRLKGIMDERDREKAFRRLVRYDINARQRKNKQLLESWEIEKAKINTKNQDILTRYSIDQESDIAYMYLLLYVADTKGENFRGVYTGTETITIDLRKALPSVLLRPCAQHGWTVKRMGMYSDLSNGVVCVLRLRVDLVDEMMGTGLLVMPENFFPPIERDSGYRILLGREAPSPFGASLTKNPRDLPSLFPFGTIQHFVIK